MITAPLQLPRWRLRVDLLLEVDERGDEQEEPLVRTELGIITASGESQWFAVGDALSVVDVDSSEKDGKANSPNALPLMSDEKDASPRPKVRSLSSSLLLAPPSTSKATLSLLLLHLPPPPKARSVNALLAAEGLVSAATAAPTAPMTDERADETS